MALFISSSVGDIGSFMLGWHADDCCGLDWVLSETVCCCPGVAIGNADDCCVCLDNDGPETGCCIDGVADVWGFIGSIVKGCCNVGNEKGCCSKCDNVEGFNCDEKAEGCIGNEKCCGVEGIVGVLDCGCCCV